MGKPKVIGGVRLSVLLPAHAIKRLKIECIERGVLESSIVLEALMKHWTLPAAGTPVSIEPAWNYMTEKERSDVAMRMMAAGQGEDLEKFLKPHLEVNRGTQAIVQLFKTAGAKPSQEAFKDAPEGDQ